MPLRLALVVVLACASAAAAQQLYRWTDDKGRVHITDTPPPASAKAVQPAKPGSPGVGAQQPYELTQALRDYPVTLYTSPGCKGPCDAARALLNKRGVPFKEVQVWDEASNAELKRVSGGDDVPTLVVGRSVHRGYEPNAYQALLDSGRYPRAGLLPPRAQAAPAPPEGYDSGAAAKPAPAPGQSEPEPPVRGPYAPRPGS